jgi:polysaccharide export outer membrane protein
VNANGFVLMPFVGSIKIKGLTRMQALDTIKSKMAKHIKDPFISIRALDVHVKVLGQVEKQGPLIMPENDATIVNALAQSGGINEFARRDSILIIREEDGIRKHIVVDMRDGQKLFSSEGYRLKHNDLLVISSNKTFYKSLRNNETNIGLGALTPITAVLGILFFTVPLISYLRR